MGIISQGNAANIGMHLKKAEVRKNVSGFYYVRVTCDSNSGAKTVRDIMQQYWEPGDGGVFTNGAYYYTPSEYGNNQMFGNWKEFAVVPQMAGERAHVACDAIKKELADIIEGVSNGTIHLPTDPDTNDPDDTDTKKTKIGDWSTYIIIGAAVAIIALLLWENRKRK